MPQAGPEQHAADAAAKALLAAAVRRARLAIFWERLWPALATLATVIGLFLAVSWLGVWLWLPPLARALGLLVFAAAVVAALLPFACCASRRQATAWRGSIATAGCRIVRPPRWPTRWR